MLEKFEELADLYISYPLQQDFVDTIVEDLLKQPITSDQNNRKNYDYATVLKRILQGKKLVDNLYSY
jgi:hypothetical protein